MGDRVKHEQTKNQNGGVYNGKHVVHYCLLRSEITFVLLFYISLLERSSGLQTLAVTHLAISRNATEVRWGDANGARAEEMALQPRVTD